MKKKDVRMFVPYFHLLIVVHILLLLSIKILITSKIAFKVPNLKMYVWSIDSVQAQGQHYLSFWD